MGKKNKNKGGQQPAGADAAEEATGAPSIHDLLAAATVSEPAPVAAPSISGLLAATANAPAAASQAPVAGAKTYLPTADKWPNE